MEITKDIKYVGVNDHKIDLFEGQYEVPNGMSYNSYVILDEKIAVMDTVDYDFKDEWLNNIIGIISALLFLYCVFFKKTKNLFKNVSYTIQVKVHMAAGIIALFLASVHAFWNMKYFRLSFGMASLGMMVIIAITGFMLKKKVGNVKCIYAVHNVLSVFAVLFVIFHVAEVIILN